MSNFFLLAISIGVLGLYVIQALTFRKVTRIDREVWDLQKQLDRSAYVVLSQIEAANALNSLLRTTHPLPPTRGWAASPDFLLALAKHALRVKPEVMVECSSGTSTIVLARCAQINGIGHVYSLEHDEKYAQQSRNQLVEQGLSQFATVIDAPLRAQFIDGESFKW